MAKPWERYGGGGDVLVGTAPRKDPAPVRPIVELTDQQELENKRLVPEDKRFQKETELRQNFEKLLPVQTYRNVLTPYVSAIQAADNQAGDLQLVYAFSKVMDPGSVVREGEMDMVTAAGGLQQRVQGYLAGLKGEGRLRPEVRAQLLREIRARSSAAVDAYNQARQQYRGLAERYGFDPEAIIGPHAGLPYQQAEAQFLGRPVRNQDGSEGPAPVRRGIGRDEEIVFNDEIPFRAKAPTDPRLEDWKQRNRQAFEAFNSAYLNGASEEELWQFSQQQFPSSMAPDWRETISKAVREREQGRPRAFVPGPIEAPALDISDTRSNEGSWGQSADAFVRGVADVGTIGLADELAAVGDTVFGGGTYAENLYRQRGIDVHDTEHNFGERISGQIAGGLVLPTGRIRGIMDMAKVGAAYGGAYGFGSGEGSIIDRGKNALLGAGAGAAGGTAIGLAAPIVSKGINALAPKVFGTAPEGPGLVAAAERQGVPLNAADVQPGTRNAFAFLESMPGSAGPIQKSVAAGRDALEQRVATLGAEGTALEANAAGQVVQDAGRRAIADLGTRARRLYGRAERLAGDRAVTAQGAVKALDTHIAELSQTGNANKGLLSLLTGLREDLSGPLSIGALRNVRTAMRGEIGTRNLTASNADRIVSDVMEAASQDIAASLADNPAALKAFQEADSFYKEKQTYIQDVLQRFLGRRDAPMSAEQTVGTLQRMAGEKGDVRRLSEMMRSLEPQERADIAATFAAQFGRRSAEEPFSPSLFLSSARKISPAARKVIFGPDGAGAIDDLIKLASAKKGTVERLNNSRSGQVSNYRALLASVLFGGPAGGAGIATVAGGSGVTGAVAGTALVGGSVVLNRAMAKAFTNPAFVRALAAAPKSSSPAAIDAHIGRLRQLAAKDPNIRSVVQSLEQSLIKAANDNVRLGAAAAENSNEPRQE